jgi:hypothetical protein
MNHDLEQAEADCIAALAAIRKAKASLRQVKPGLDALVEEKFKSALNTLANGGEGVRMDDFIRKTKNVAKVAQRAAILASMANQGLIRIETVPGKGRPCRTIHVAPQ